jgi:hypothetical protein
MADIADPLPPSEPAPIVASSETATDTYVPVFRKELKKKDAEQEDAEFASAKAYLSTKYGKDSQSVYDHLTSLVSRILETKPANALGMWSVPVILAL